MVKNYQGEDFNQIIQNRVLVDFYADWCGPCRMLGPVLENVSDEIEIIKVNIDNYQELAKKYGIMSIPCIVLFDKEKEVKRNIGFIPLDKVKEFIK